MTGEPVAASFASSHAKFTEVNLSDEEEAEEMKGLNIFEGSIALLSVIIGGGIVGIPFAMY